MPLTSVLQGHSGLHDGSLYNWEYFRIVVSAFIMSFVMAFSIGANDVANSFGTTVGSKVLTIRQACLCAVVFETLGAMVLGNRVTDTLWRDIVDISVYRGVKQERTLILGEISALIGTAVWVLAATLLKIPVSGTHAIVGATVGYSLVNQGPSGVQWFNVFSIGGSWFMSPILAGIVSGAFFVIIRRYVLEAEDPTESGLKLMPVFYAAAIFINVMTVFIDGWLIPGLMDRLPWWATLTLSMGLALVTAVFVRWCVVPLQRKKIKKIIENHRALRITYRRRHTIESVSMTGIDQEEIIVRPPTYLLGQTPRVARSSLHRSSSGVHRYRSSSVKRKASGNQAAGQELNQMEKEEFLAELRFKRIHDPNRISDSSGSRSSDSFNATSALGSEGTSSATNSDSAIVRSASSAAAAAPSKCRRNTNDSTVTQTGNSIAIEVVREQQSNRSSILQKLSSCCWCKKSSRSKDLLQAAKRDHDRPEIVSIFSYLQIVTSALTAFAHGGNDVCNAVGPLTGIWLVFTNGRFQEETRTPFWLLCFGGLGISIGLCILGRKVIETVGSSLSSNITPSSGFCIGLGTACTVLIASELGMPISTTHCIIGSVVSVGWLRSSDSVNWKVFGSIMGCALLTLPVAAGCGAAAMAILRLLPDHW